jgi:hypothetical protein
MVGEGIAVEVACRVLAVSVSGTTPGCHTRHRPVRSGMPG